MLRSPISETGKIRYVEIVKIAVLILSFFAWFSYISEYAETFLNVVHVQLFIEVTILVTLLVLAINEFHTIIALIQALKIKILSYQVKENVSAVLHQLKTVVVLYKNKYFITFNVFRC